MENFYMARGKGPHDSSRGFRKIGKARATSKAMKKFYIGPKVGRYGSHGPFANRQAISSLFQIFPLFH